MGKRSAVVNGRDIRKLRNIYTHFSLSISFHILRSYVSLLPTLVADN